MSELHDPHVVYGAISRGAAWMVGVRWGVKGLGLISSVVLARLLTPDDFGLVAMAMSVYALIRLVREFGFGNAIIQNQRAVQEDYDTAWTLQLMLSAFASVALFACAGEATAFYEDERLEYVLYALSVAFMLSGLHNIGVIDYQKHMEFRSVFALNMVPKVASFAITLSLAIYLRSYWALVIGQISNSLITLLMSYVMHSYRPKLHLGRWRRLLSFSSWLLVNNIIKYIDRHGRNLILAKFGGAPLVGLISIASEFATLVALEVVQPINTAAFPGYSKVSANAEALRDTFEKVLEAIAIVAIPASVGLAVIAPVFVPVVLGAQWLDAIDIIPLMSLGSIFFALASSVDVALMAVKQQRVTTLYVVIRLVCFLAVMVFLLPRHGALAVAEAYLVANLAVTPLYLWIVRRVFGVSMPRLLRISLRPALASGVMAMAVGYCIRDFSLSVSTLNGVGYLLGSVAAGVLVFSAVALCLCIVMGDREGIEYRLLIAKLPSRLSP